MVYQAHHSRATGQLDVIAPPTSHENSHTRRKRSFVALFVTTTVMLVMLATGSFSPSSLMSSPPSSSSSAVTSLHHKGDKIRRGASGTVAVFGASGKLGTEVVKELLDNHYNVKALVRKPKNGKKLKESSKNLKGKLEIVYGDAYDQESVNKVIKGTSITINVMGTPRSDSKTATEALEGTPEQKDRDEHVCSATQPIINSAIDRFNPKSHLVVVTSMGTAENIKCVGFLIWMLSKTSLRKPLADKALQEAEVRKMKKWTIVRPGGLNDKLKNEGEYHVDECINSGLVSRSQVAQFIVEEVIKTNQKDEAAGDFTNRAVSIVSK